MGGNPICDYNYNESDCSGSGECTWDGQNNSCAATDTAACEAGAFSFAADCEGAGACTYVTETESTTAGCYASSSLSRINAESAAADATAAAEAAAAYGDPFIVPMFAINKSE